MKELLDCSYLCVFTILAEMFCANLLAEWFEKFITSQLQNHRKSGNRLSQIQTALCGAVLWQTGPAAVSHWFHVPHLSLQHQHSSNRVALGTDWNGHKLLTGKISDQISSMTQPVVTSCKWQSHERGRGMEKKVRLQQTPFKSDTQAHKT